MSILTDLRSGRITFSQAFAQAVAWGQKVIGHDSTLTDTVGQVVDDLKSAAGVAAGELGSAFAKFIGPATATFEVTLDAVLAKYTGGLSLPFDPQINDTIDRIEAAGVAEINAWALQAKSRLTPAGAPVSSTASTSLSTAASVSQGAGGQ